MPSVQIHKSASGIIVFKTQNAHMVLQGADIKSLILWGKLNMEKIGHLLEVPWILTGGGVTLRISSGPRDHGCENQGGCLGLHCLPSQGSSGMERTAGVVWWGCLEMGLRGKHTEPGFVKRCSWWEDALFGGWWGG